VDGDHVVAAGVERRRQPAAEQAAGAGDQDAQV
jgi:hypothetical protein